MDTLKDKHNLETLAATGHPPWEVWAARNGNASELETAAWS
jgi:hypothetical protein